jgi:surfeit locus 1 family protein
VQKLSFQLGNYIWTPRSSSTIVVLVVIAVLCSLGWWQLDRAEQKRQLLQQSIQKLHAPPIPLHTLDKNSVPAEFTQITTTGHLDPQHTLLLDNQFFQHQAGYNVISPFIPDNDTEILLVDRGWIPLTQDRNTWPTVKTVTHAITLIGNARNLQNQGILLGDNIETRNPHQWRVARLDNALVHKLSKALAKPIYPFILVLPPQSPYGYARESILVLNMPPARHIAYAIQWFALAVLAASVYFLLHLQRKE